MSEISNNKNVREDEIDLFELFRRIGKSLGNLVTGFLKVLLITIVFLLKNWIPLSISIIAGIGLSYLLKTTSTSFYTTELVFRNNLVNIDKKTFRDNSGTTAEMISKINKLHFFCLENNTLSLSSALSMEPESVKAIADIGAHWIIDLNRDGIPDYVDYKGTHNVYDTVNVRIQSSFNVRVKFNSSIDLAALRTGIIKYIEEDTLFQQRNRLRLKQNREMLTRLNYDIKQLDSLQKVKYFEETRNMKPGNGGQIIFMQESNTQLVYNDIYFLYDKKQVLETENDLYKGILTVMSDFSLPSIRENGLMFYGKKIIPLFFLVTLLILILLANRKNIQELFKKY